MNNTPLFRWAVIGAGPAGIAAVGKLIDNGVNPKDIAWIDLEFRVGDFGTHWRKVSSNTKVKLFLKFFRECRAFEYSLVQNNFAIETCDPDKTCLLSLAADPLQWITNNLKNKVCSIQDEVFQLKTENDYWEIKLNNYFLLAKNIILATGAEPKSLALPSIEEISLITGLNPEKLADVCNEDDLIAVFGSSHSAILILKNLIEQNKVKKIINFYLSPLKYAVYYDDWILYDNTGLKGIAAEWAKKNIDCILPAKLKRIISNQENLGKYLPQCTKAIYATGFQSRSISIEGISKLKYCNKTGVIAPGLFGLGIAFPEAHIDRAGNFEYRVGLWKFMDYLNRVMPEWIL